MSQTPYHQALQRLRAADPNLAQAPAAVLCLCAAWCRLCDEYRTVFDAARAAHPQLRFRWVDIEDEAEALGDLDIETFPTLLIACGDTLRHAGPLPPQAAVLERLLRDL